MPEADATATGSRPHGFTRKVHHLKPAPGHVPHVVPQLRHRPRALVLGEYLELVLTRSSATRTGLTIRTFLACWKSRSGLPVVWWHGTEHRPGGNPAGHSRRCAARAGRSPRPAGRSWSRTFQTKCALACKDVRSEMMKPAKNTICLWYDGGAEGRPRRFYARTFPDSSIGADPPRPGRLSIRQARQMY